LLGNTCIFKRYEGRHIKFKYSRRTVQAAENRKASGLCPTQTARWGSTAKANGVRNSEPENVSRMTSYIRRRNFGGCRRGDVPAIFLYLRIFFWLHSGRANKKIGV